MSLLEVFTMQFVTEGLKDIPQEAQEADAGLDKLTITTEELEEKTEKTSVTAEEAARSFEKEGKAAEKTDDKLKNVKETTEKTVISTKKLNSDLGQNGLAGFLVEGIRKFSPYIIALNLLKGTFSNLQKAMEFKIPISRETISNIKELEFTMRDIRAGTAQIGANLASSMLPSLKVIAKVANNIVKFLGGHMDTIKIALGVIGVTLLPEIIKGIQLLGWSWKKTGLALALTGVILLLDDIYAWMQGGGSAFGNFYNKIFGSAEQFNKKLGDIVKTLKEMPTWLQVISGALVALVALNPFKSLLIGGKGLVAVLKFIPPLITTIFTVLKGITALFITNPILLAITAIVAATVLVWKNWDKIVDSVKKAINATKQFLGLKENKDTVNGSHASGLDYVPFDGYVAELHKGERVQTAAEAQDWRSSLMAAKKAVDFTANYPLNSIPSGAISNTYNNSSPAKNINIGDITINTQATDAQGIAFDLAKHIKQAMISLDDGMLA